MRDPASIGERRGWDSNPRRLAPQRFSRPSDSTALAPRRDGEFTGRARSDRQQMTSIEAVLFVSSDSSTWLIASTTAECVPPAQPEV